MDSPNFYKLPTHFEVVKTNSLKPPTCFEFVKTDSLKFCKPPICFAVVVRMDSPNLYKSPTRFGAFYTLCVRKNRLSKHLQASYMCC